VSDLLLTTISVIANFLIGFSVTYLYFSARFWRKSYYSMRQCADEALKGWQEAQDGWREAHKRIEASTKEGEWWKDTPTPPY